MLDENAERNIEIAVGQMHGPFTASDIYFKLAPGQATQQDVMKKLAEMCDGGMLHHAGLGDVGVLYSTDVEDEYQRETRPITIVWPVVSPDTADDIFDAIRQLVDDADMGFMLE